MRDSSIVFSLFSPKKICICKEKYSNAYCCKQKFSLIVLIYGKGRGQRKKNKVIGFHWVCVWICNFASFLKKKVRLIINGNFARFVSLKNIKVWNGILLPKLFWPPVRNNCSSDQEELWNSRMKARNLQTFWDH